MRVIAGIVVTGLLAVLIWLPGWGDDGPPRIGDAVVKSEEQWRQDLTPEQYRVLRAGGTEPAFRNAYWDEHRRGVYHCAGCAAPLFDSDQKFDSGTGWPSFTAPLEDNVGTESDRSAWLAGTEVRCRRCGGHLGHVFHDGPPPTGTRYCINSASLDFRPATAESTPEEGEAHEAE